MATQKPHPVTHVYKEVNEGKHRTVKHFELQKCNNTPIFSNLINISENQNCAQSMPIYWLKLREGNKWTKYITGLFKTHYPSIYKGDKDHKKHLIVFKFSRDKRTLTIDYYKDYYTNDLGKIIS